MDKNGKEVKTGKKCTSLKIKKTHMLVRSDVTLASLVCPPYTVVGDCEVALRGSTDLFPTESIQIECV